MGEQEVGAGEGLARVLWGGEVGGGRGGGAGRWVTRRTPAWATAAGCPLPRPGEGEGLLGTMFGLLGTCRPDVLPIFSTLAGPVPVRLSSALESWSCKLCPLPGLVECSCPFSWASFVSGCPGHCAHTANFPRQQVTGHNRLSR